MPDGECVTTGSEPRRWTLIRNGEEWAVTTSDRLMFNADEAVEAQEVVEPGHDEQTRCADCGKPITPARAEDSSYQHGPWFCEACFAARSEWRPDPRTVAAVVEALRGVADELAPHEPAQASGVLIGIDRIENDPRFKPSVLGGDTGPVA